MANRWGNSGNSDRLYFGGSKLTADGDCSHEIKKTLAPWKKSYDQPRQHIKKQGYYFANKGLYSQAMVFLVVMCECESWTIKKAEHWRIWCFWTVVLEKTLESPLDFREIQPVNHKGNQSWLLIGRTNAKAEAPILWPPNAKSWLIRKDPDAGKGWSVRRRRRCDDWMTSLSW